MTEAEILEQVIATRAYLDQTIYQLIALTVAVVVGVYYFLHRAGWGLKAAAGVLYAIGWFTQFSSASITSQHLIGYYTQLNALIRQGQASPPTVNLMRALNDPTAMIYVLVMNIGLWFLLIGAFAFLAFWKAPVEHRRG